MSQILSDIITINKPEKLSVQEIERELEQKFGSIIRWAIIDIINNKLKISISYKTKEG